MKIESIYIAGPISNVPDYKQRFSKAKELLREWGFEKIINPVKIAHANVDNWSLCMAEDISFWLDFQCEFQTGVALLNGWQLSKGASLEKYIAEELGIPFLPLHAWHKVAENNFIISDK